MELEGVKVACGNITDHIGSGLNLKFIKVIKLKVISISSGIVL